MKPRDLPAEHFPAEQEFKHPTSKISIFSPWLNINPYIAEKFGSIWFDQVIKTLFSWYLHYLYLISKLSFRLIYTNTYKTQCKSNSEISNTFKNITCFNLEFAKKNTLFSSTFLTTSLLNLNPGRIFQYLFGIDFFLSTCFNNALTKSIP